MDGRFAGPAIHDPGLQPADQVVPIPAAQVAMQLGDRHMVRSSGREVRESVQDVLGSIAGRAEGEPDLAPGTSQPGAHLHQAAHPGLVVRVVDDDDATPQFEQVRPPGISVGVQHERLQPRYHRAFVHSRAERRRDRAHGVERVVRGDAGDGERHVLQRHQRLGVATSRQDGDPADIHHAHVTAAVHVHVEIEIVRPDAHGGEAVIENSDASFEAAFENGKEESEKDDHGWSAKSMLVVPEKPEPPRH